MLQTKEPNNNMVEQKGITSKGVHPTKNLVVSNNNNNLDREAISNPNLRRDLTHHHRTYGGEIQRDKFVIFHTFWVLCLQGNTHTPKG